MSNKHFKSARMMRRERVRELCDQRMTIEYHDPFLTVDDKIALLRSVLQCPEDSTRRVFAFKDRNMALDSGRADATGTNAIVPRSAALVEGFRLYDMQSGEAFEIKMVRLTPTNTPHADVYERDAFRRQREHAVERGAIERTIMQELERNP